MNIILKLWTEPRATFEGKYYQVKDAFGAPKPVQEPHPPVWVGGKQRRMLGIAARYAEGVNIAGFPSLGQYKDGLDLLRSACDQHGRDYDTIKKSHFTGIAIAPNRAAVDDLVKEIAGSKGQSVDEVRATFRGFIGTPSEVVDFLAGFAELGVEQFMLVFPYQHEAESVELIGKEVLPKLT